MRDFERLQYRRDTTAAWTAVNPVLLDGEPGYDKDSGVWKIGDGVTAWVDLPGSNQVGTVVADASALMGTAPVAVMPDRVLTTNGNRPVGKGELVVYTADYASVQAAIDAAPAGATVLVAEGTHDEQLTITDPGMRLVGKGPDATTITSSTGDVLTLSSTVNLARIEVADLTLESTTGGGHLVTVPFGINQSVFRRVQMLQRNPGKSLLYCHRAATNGGLFDNRFTDCYFNMNAGSTVPGFDVVGAGNACSANLWERCRAQGGGTYLFHIEAGPGNYVYNNTFSAINFEYADHGGIRVLSGMNTAINEVGFFDNGTIDTDLIRVGQATGASQSRGTAIRSVHRSNGTLTNGAVDVHLVSGENAGTSVIEAISGTFAGDVTVDVGNSSGYALVLGYDQATVTLLNAASGRVVTIAAETGIAAPALTINGVNYLSGNGSPEGVVTGTSGSLYSRVDGAGPGRLYVKGTGGTSNTGWYVVSTTPA